MGKASKKLVRKQQKNKTIATNLEVQQLKQELQQQMAQEVYDEALGTLAELVQKNCVEPELMYDGAYCYFMTGDYERAVTWINNTLTYQPNHINARILLARICLLQERVDDGLAIYDFVLEKYASVLDEAQKREITEPLEYYERNEKALLQEKYRHIADLMGLETELPAAESTSDEIARPLADRGTNEVEQSPKMEAEISEIEKIEEMVQNKPVSLQEKVRMFNAFAASFFYDGKFSEAQRLLSAAMALDAYAPDTLRNMAYTMMALGEKQPALELASKMPMADFGLLYHLREI